MPFSCTFIPSSRSTCAQRGSSLPSRPHFPLLALSRRRGDYLSAHAYGAPSDGRYGQTEGRPRQGSSAPVPHNVKDRIMEALRPGFSMYNPGAIAHLVDDLIPLNPTPQPAKSAFDLGQGTWEVFSAPHIITLTRPTGIRFEPVRYTLDGSHISSNVKVQGPLGLSGWLSAAGRLVAKPDGNTVEVVFSDFWFDYGAEALRADITGKRDAGPIDAVVTQLGRLGFFPALSVYPVLYLDEDICVFKFSPLDSTIACRKVAPIVEPASPQWTIASMDSDV